MSGECAQMYVTSVDNVREYEVNVEEAYGVKVKYLLHEGVGAKKIQLRLFTIAVGGHTAHEKHAHEHEVFILRGKGIIRGKDAEMPSSFLPSRSTDLKM